MFRTSRIFLICVLLFTTCLESCRRAGSELQFALNQAGENRVELKQVLNHYKTIEDKEKLRAAEYLIRNMPYHRAFIGDVEEYRQSLDSLLPEMSSVSRYNELMFGLNRQFIKKKNLMYDVENISSEFLIQNIEESFRLLLRHG